MPQHSPALAVHSGDLAFALPAERATTLTATRFVGTLLVGLGLFMAFFELGGYRVLTAHEAYVAVPAREMLVSGDWIVPRFGDVPRLEKPPLAYWLVAGLSALLGRMDAWVVRLPSTLAMLGLALLMAHWAGRRYGRIAGLAAGTAQMTMGYVLSFGRKAEVDILLCLLTTSALYLVAHQPGAESGRAAGRRWAAIGLLLGLSFLAKFHYGPVMVLGPFVVFQLVRGTPRRLLDPLRPVGLILFGLCVVVWPVLVLRQAPEAAATWWHETVHRALPGTFEDQPWWFYVPHLVSLTMPWTLLALLAVPACWKRAWRRGREHDRFLWIWFAVQLLIMSVSANKHRHYLMATLPVFTLLVAETVARWARERRCTGEPLVGPRFAIRWTVISAAIAWFAHEHAVNRWPDLEGTFDLLASLGTLTAAGTTWLLVFRREVAAVTAGVAGVAVIFAVCQTWVIPHTDHRDELARFSQRVRVAAGSGTLVHAYGLGTSPALFYLGAPVRRVGTEAPLEDVVAAEPRFVVTPRERAEAVAEAIGGRIVAFETESRQPHDLTLVAVDPR